MECKQQENLRRCPCPSTTCTRKGLCCDCLANHLSHRQFPACVFPNDGRQYERSFDSFAKLVAAGGI